jgi:hypothetical protein
MSKPSDSLGGKNSGGRPASARSSRARSTAWRKLRKLDRKIAGIDWELWLAGKFGNPQHIEKLNGKRAVFDTERRKVRHQRKAYVQA